MHQPKKYILFIALTFVGITTLTNSNLAFSEIYKWRDAKGVIQYSDTAPAGNTKALRAEMLNALQTKEICRAPDPANSKKTAAKLEANFFGFNNPNTVGFMGQPASKRSGLSGLGIGNLVNPTRPVAAKLPSWFGCRLGLMWLQPQETIHLALSALIQHRFLTSAIGL
jgi:Domain of unknown function (DUF4124)